MLKHQKTLISRGILSINRQSGFTLAETLTVLFLMAIAIGIAAPSWMKFMHFQRIHQTTARIMQTLSQAQKQAQREKRTVSIRFKTRDGIPLVSQYYPNDEANWEPLLDDLGIKPGQIDVFGQLDNLTLTFNHKGVVSTQIPYTIKVAAPNRHARPSYRRCVVVRSLLGAKTKGSKPKECPTRKGASPAKGEVIY